MNLPTITAKIIILDAVILIAYDVWAKVKEPDGKATISFVLLTAAKQMPLILLGVGILIGHLFFPQHL